MTDIELIVAAVVVLAVLIGAGLLTGRAINAPEGRHAAPRDNADEAAALAWFRAARVPRIPPQVTALVHVTALRAALAGATVEQLLRADPYPVHVDGPIPPPPADEADHLQPQWEDATGTFSAIAGVTR